MKNKGLALSRVEGFTLIELIVVITIITVLSGIILFSVSLYINKGKDSNISGNLAVLIPAGEVYYNVSNKYNGFCTSDVANNAFNNQMPPNTAHFCGGDLVDNSQSWAACAKEFTDPNSAFCVDSRGVKEVIDIIKCTQEALNISPQCPVIIAQ